MFVTHAQTAEQLRQEIISDIRRRLEVIGNYKAIVARSKAAQARYDCAIRELEDMLKYWSEVVIAPPKPRNRRPTPAVPVPSHLAARKDN